MLKINSVLKSNGITMFKFEMIKWGVQNLSRSQAMTYFNAMAAIFDFEECLEIYSMQGLEDINTISKFELLKSYRIQKQCILI